MYKTLYRIIAIFLILLFFLPLPGGTLYFAIGLSMLICSSRPFALWLQRLRRNYLKINKVFLWLENKIGEKWAGSLIITRPESDLSLHFKD